MTIRPNRTERVPVLSFAREISADLEDLMFQHPTGIYLSNLQDYYGESIARIQKAVDILEGQKSIVKKKSANNSYYILPASPDVIERTGAKQKFAGLTVLQVSVVEFLEKECKRQQVTRLRTNYSQLTRILNCSYGGLKQCLQRLVSLEYLRIEEPSKRGKSDQMIIALGTKLDS